MSQPRLPEVESSFVPDTICRGDRDKKARQRPSALRPHRLRPEHISSDSRIQTRSASCRFRVRNLASGTLELRRRLGGGALWWEEQRRQCPCWRRPCPALPVLPAFSLHSLRPWPHWTGRGHGKDDAQDLVVVDGDPLARMEDIDHVVSTVCAGVVFDSAAVYDAVSVRPLAPVAALSRATGHK